MSHKYFDLVAQYTETTGTGAYTLMAAVANRRTFGSVLSNGDTTDYKVEGVDNAGSPAWEVGVGTYATSGTTLGRTTIRSSSTGSAINWGTGLKTVTMVQAAGSIVSTTPTANRIKASGITPANGAVPIGNGTDFTVATLTGTSNQVTVTNGVGTITLGLPQNIGTGSIPTFGGMILASSGTIRCASDTTGINIFASTGGYPTNGGFVLRGNTGGVGGVADKGIEMYARGREQVRVVGVDNADRLLMLYGGYSSSSTHPVIGSTSGVTDLTGSARFTGVGTTASAANAYLDNTASNSLLRSTSSMRYKTDAEPIDLEIVREIGPKLLEAAIWYRSLAPADRPGWSWYGMGAEMVAAIDPRLVHWTYPADAYEDVVTGTVDDDVPVLEEVDEAATEIVVEEGRAVLRSVTRTDQRQIVDLLPVVTEAGEPVTDGDGQPLYHPVPRVQKVTREVTERRLKDGAQMIPDGVQYERVALILALYLADRMDKAGIAA